MREPPPPAGSLHCQSAAASEGPETGERGKEKGPSGTETQSVVQSVLLGCGIATEIPSHAGGMTCCNLYADRH
ncbi:UNVERIFIED_CONTAM: hypothetical protein FKN15_061418 [Acipenser sinensis]